MSSTSDRTIVTPGFEISVSVAARQKGIAWRVLIDRAPRVAVPLPQKRMLIFAEARGLWCVNCVVPLLLVLTVPRLDWLYHKRSKIPGFRLGGREVEIRPHYSCLFCATQQGWPGPKLLSVIGHARCAHVHCGVHKRKPWPTERVLLFVRTMILVLIGPYSLLLLSSALLMAAVVSHKYKEPIIELSSTPIDNAGWSEDIFVSDRVIIVNFYGV